MQCNNMYYSNIHFMSRTVLHTIFTSTISISLNITVGTAGKVTLNNRAFAVFPSISLSLMRKTSHETEHSHNHIGHSHAVVILVATKTQVGKCLKS